MVFYLSYSDLIRDCAVRAVQGRLCLSVAVLRFSGGAVVSISSVAETADHAVRRYYCRVEPLTVARNDVHITRDIDAG